MTILFYGTQGPFGCFSNLSPHAVELGGTRWPTTEHYFQAQKFAGTPHEEEIRSASSPAIAARMGRSRQRPLRKDWEAVKDEVMLAAVHAKVRQHPEVREALLATGEEEIVEASPKDRYWGAGADGHGKNRLGQIFVEVRALLRREG